MDREHYLAKRRAYARVQRERYPERIAARKKRWLATPAGQEKAKVSQQQSRQRRAAHLRQYRACYRETRREQIAAKAHAKWLADKACPARHAAILARSRARYARRADVMREQQRQHRTKLDPDGIRIGNRSAKQLKDSYVANLVRIPVSLATPELLAVKRTIIQIKRRTGQTGKYRPRE